MSEKQTDKSVQTAREKALYQYANALERGDFTTIEVILEQAICDTELERMIFELHEEYRDEHESAHVSDAALVRELIREHLPSGLTRPGDEDLEMKT
jgi:hypothetical protein